jgi:hypothetical protein
LLGKGKNEAYLARIPFLNGFGMVREKIEAEAKSKAACRETGLKGHVF